jgi:hypothetical protein
MQQLFLRVFFSGCKTIEGFFDGLMTWGAAEKVHGAYPCRYLTAARSLLHEE